MARDMEFIVIDDDGKDYEAFSEIISCDLIYNFRLYSSPRCFKS